MSSLAELPQIRYQDPLSGIDWAGVDRECWWMPPSLLSLAGVVEFEALPLRQRQVLSHLEYAHLLEAGLWLESQFMARLARLAQRSEDVVRRARLLHELREEAGHSLMFVELLHRSGYGFHAGRSVRARLAEALGRLVPSEAALFWAMAVAGEEIPDQLNRRLRRAVEEVTLSSVVYRIACIHMRDEATHLAYGREQCELSASRCPSWQRRLLAPWLSATIELYARYVYFPSAATYARAGMRPAQLWRVRALGNPRRRAQVAQLLRPTVTFLRRSGWPIRSGLCRTH
jgi:hypothetical protein